MSAAPDERPDSGLLERAWYVLSRWAVPAMMSLAYVLLAATSDTNATGKAWMAAGFGLVMIAWFVFRALAEAAALTRALRVGDTVRLFALADRHLARARSPGRRARFLVARGLGHLLRGAPAEALAALEGATPPPDLAALARVVRLAAQGELGAAATAHDAPAAPARLAPALDWLAEALVAWRAGDLATASARLVQVIDDVRAGSATRAMAHAYAARIAAATGDAAAAARHHMAATNLATSDATWLRARP